MTIRFFILQSHYRSTLDFSSEALVASEKAFKRLWEAYEVLKKLAIEGRPVTADTETDKKIRNWLGELESFMDDDFSTPKVLANLFEIAPLINSLKDGLLPADAISSETLQNLKEQFRVYLEEIFGLCNPDGSNNERLQSVMQLLIDIRKEAKANKDFVTSDKIRNQLTAMGIMLKDEKDGTTSWGLA
jgi:cysteinyl-tRNA synthetase